MVPSTPTPLPPVTAPSTRRIEGSVLIISLLGSAAFFARGIATLSDQRDFATPGTGWRAVLQIALGLMLLAAVQRRRRDRQGVVGAIAVVGMVHLAMAVWERFDDTSAFGLIEVTPRDRWAHPAIGLFALALVVLARQARPMQRNASVTRTISAPPEHVFRFITDLNNMGTLSSETTKCVWENDRRGVGAGFTGTNMRGDRTWTTYCVVTELSQAQRFAFEVVKPARLSRWTYAVRPRPGGCEVTETWEDLRNPLVRFLSARRSGINDRATHNKQTMIETLTRLDQIASAGARPQ